MHNRPRHRRLLPLILSLVAPTLATLPLASAKPASADAPGKAIYEKASPSLVIVQYVWDSEMRRQEVTAVGLIIGEGLVLVPSFVVPEQIIPDSQIKDFKIVVPRTDAENDEIEATLLGRDERWQVAYIKAKDPSALAKLPAVKFTDKPVAVGESVYSVGLLPKTLGYRPYLATGSVAVRLRGEVPQVLVSNELAGSGSPVFDAAGDAVGFVQPHDGAFFWLEPRPQRVTDSPRFFVPASEILPSLTSIPEGGKYPPVPFTGIMSLNALSKDLSEVFKLTGKPAVEIGDVVPNSPAATAGLEKGMIITELDGKPLQRTDNPDETGELLDRQILRKLVGGTAEMTVIAKQGEPPKKVTLTLTERPAQPNTAARFYAEDLGYTVRDAVFADRYTRRLAEDAKGVVVDFIKPSSSAQTARLTRGDMVTQLNGQPVTDVATFKTSYEAFRSTKPKDPLVLQVLREGNTQIIKIDPPQ